MGTEMAGEKEYLILCCSSPICKALWIRDAFLEAVGSKGTKHHRGCAVETADGPEWWRHVAEFNVDLAVKTVRTSKKIGR